MEASKFAAGEDHERSQESTEHGNCPKEYPKLCVPQPEGRELDWSAYEHYVLAIRNI